MKVNLFFENACATGGSIPTATQVQRWAEAALLSEPQDSVSLSVRVVDEPEITELNRRYRSKPGPTNVLSFPFEDPPGVDSDELGDVVVCAPVVEREALEQGKTTEEHWAHMVVHGILHLCGYDHIEDVDAEKMENEETRILTGLGFPAPYN